MKLAFVPRAWEDYLYWQGQDRAMLRRVNRLIEETMRTPTQGVGKPELLRHVGGNVWSRRIDQEHRLVYLVEASQITIIQARFHY